MGVHSRLRVDRALTSAGASNNGDLCTISDDPTDAGILVSNRWREWGMPCFCFALNPLEYGISN